MATDYPLEVVHQPPRSDDLGGYSIEVDGRRVAFVWPRQYEIVFSDGRKEPISPFGADDPERLAKLFAASPRMYEFLAALANKFPYCGDDCSCDWCDAKRLLDQIDGAT